MTRVPRGSDDSAQEEHHFSTANSAGYFDRFGRGTTDRNEFLAADPEAEASAPHKMIDIEHFCAPSSATSARASKHAVRTPQITTTSALPPRSSALLDRLPNSVMFAKCCGSDTLRVETEAYDVIVRDAVQQQRWFSEFKLDFLVEGFFTMTTGSTTTNTQQGTSVGLDQEQRGRRSRVRKCHQAQRRTFAVRRTVADFQWLAKIIPRLLPGFFLPPLSVTDVQALADAAAEDRGWMVREMQAELRLWLVRMISRPHFILLDVLQAWLGIDLTTGKKRKPEAITLAGLEHSFCSRGKMENPQKLLQRQKSLCEETGLTSVVLAAAIAEDGEDAVADDPRFQYEFLASASGRGGRSFGVPPLQRSYVRASSSARKSTNSSCEDLIDLSGGGGAGVFRNETHGKNTRTSVNGQDISTHAKSISNSADVMTIAEDGCWNRERSVSPGLLFERKDSRDRFKRQQQEDGNGVGSNHHHQSSIAFLDVVDTDEEKTSNHVRQDKVMNHQSGIRAGTSTEPTLLQENEEDATRPLARNPPNGMTGAASSSTSRRGQYSRRAKEANIFAPKGVTSKATNVSSASLRWTAHDVSTSGAQTSLFPTITSQEGCAKFLAGQKRLLHARRTELASIQRNFACLRKLEKSAFVEGQKLHKTLAGEENMNRTLVNSLAPSAREFAGKGAREAHAVYSIMIAACERETMDIEAGLKIFDSLASMASRVQQLRKSLKDAKDKRLNVKFSEQGLFWDAVFKGMTKEDQLAHVSDRIAVLKKSLSGMETWTLFANFVATEELKTLRQDRAQKWKNAQEEFVARQREVGGGGMASAFLFRGTQIARGIVSRADLAEWGLDSHEGSNAGNDDFD
ncbi:unnamed protein product [Amoebophrya sp. A25]|nr:unnamed protein product [Amoebophrya sp. A25]|eukprot:GSA25T00000120001.1